MLSEMKPPSYWSAVALALGIAIATGYGRFAYALILPEMRADLGWNYAMAGLPNTWNAIGNIAGALLALLALRRLEPRWVFSAGLLLTSFSLLVTGISRNFEWIALLRFLAGVGGSAAFASGGALVAKLFETAPQRSGTAIAIYFGGGGFGITVSSLTVPVLAAFLGATGWPYSWTLLGLLGIGSAIAPVAIALRIPIAPSPRGQAAYSLRTSSAMLLSYSLFGGGYIVYLTFAFAWMREHHVSVLGSSIVWVLLGIAIMLSPWVWRRPMTHWYPSRVLAACALATCIAATLPIMSSSYPLIASSAILFGGSFFMAPSAVTAFTRRHFRATAWAPIITIFTTLFSALQAASPLIAGTVADLFGLELGFALGASLLLASCFSALVQRRLSDPISRDS